MANVAGILSGGGSRGAFEVGVLKKLFYNGVPLDSVYGTSAGALNATGFSFMGVDNLWTLWNKIENIDAVFGKKHIPIAIFEMLFCKGKGYYNMDPLIRTLTRIVNVYNPRIPATVSYTSLLTEEQVYTTAYPNISYDKSLFIKGAVASAATPVLNDLIDGEFCDGGIRHITPVNKAILDGATELYVILAEPYEQSGRWTTKPGNVLDTGLRALNALVQEIFWRDVQDAVNSGLPTTIYAPLAALPDPLNFKHDTIAKSLQLGLDARPVYIANKN